MNITKSVSHYTTGFSFTQCLFLTSGWPEDWKKAMVKLACPEEKSYRGFLLGIE